MEEESELKPVCPYSWGLCFLDRCPAYKKKNQFYAGSGCKFIDENIPPYR